MKLIDIMEISGSIILESGLHIGAGDNEMHIGGTDNPVIKHPHSNDPYIPGSSLKGKIRSLLEWRLGLVEYNQGKPFGYAQLAQIKGNASLHEQARNLVKLFGVSGGDQLDNRQAAEIGPSRLAFRDCGLDQAWREKIRSRNLLLTESKSENTINRIAGVAEHPRNTERVPAGATFGFTLALKLLEGDDKAAMLDLVFTGLKLLEMDTLGGSGSRGYGKVSFHLQGELAGRLAAIDPFGRAA